MKPQLKTVPKIVEILETQPAKLGLGRKAAAQARAQKVIDDYLWEQNKYLSKILKDRNRKIQQLEAKLKIMIKSGQ